MQDCYENNFKYIYMYRPITSVVTVKIAILT